MGFLKIFGRVLDFEESNPYIKIIKDSGVDKTKLWNIFDDVKSTNRKFGFEFEFHKVLFDHDKNSVKIDLDAYKEVDKHQNVLSDYIYQPEYGKWMIEGKFL